jgi:hypothetical protein
LSVLRHRNTLLARLAPPAALLVCMLVFAAPAFAVPGYRIDASTGAAFVPGTANLFPSGADDAVVRISTTASAPYRLPFAVKAYGTTYTGFWVSTNGNLQFTNNPGSPVFTNSCFATSVLPEPVIAPYWDDLFFNPQGSGEGVFSKTYGTAPNRRYLISWRGHLFSDTGAPVRAEVIFYQNSARITTIYSQGDGAQATIGVQRGSSGPTTQWACNYGSTVLFSGLRLDYVPTP